MQSAVGSLLRGSRFAHSEHGLRPRSRAYALRVIHLFEALPKSGTSNIIGKQLLRAGTSVGAHVAEASRAKSRCDFVSKLEGAMQELEETVYWIELLSDTKIVKPPRLEPLIQESAELMAIMIAMVKKTRQTERVSA